MRFKTFFCFLILIAANAVFAETDTKVQAGLQNYAKSILKKDFKKVLIKNHPKSNRLDISFKVPESWAEQEGDRSNVIKKYKSSVVPDGLQFIISSNPATESIENLDFGVLSDSDPLEMAAEMTPKDALVVGKRIVHLDGRRTILIEYKNQHERAGLVTYAHNINYFTFYGNSSVMFAASVGSDSFENASMKMSYFRPIIMKVVISIVFNDQWTSKKIDQISLSSMSEQQPSTNQSRRFFMMMVYSLPMLIICYLIAFITLRNKVIVLDKIELLFGFALSWFGTAEVYYLFGLKYVESNIGAFMLPISIAFASILILKNYKIRRQLKFK